MQDDLQPVSKLLIIDDDPQALEQLRAFCAMHRLRPLRASAGDVLGVLGSMVDLGALVIAEHQGADGSTGLRLARTVHALRPELPVFLRRPSLAAGPLPAAMQRHVAACFDLDSLDRLAQQLDTWLFSMVYPNSLVRSIRQMTLAALQSQFRALQVEIDTPYVVRDRLIHGELFTLMPVESDWCRGYVMLQAQEEPLQALIRGGRTYLEPQDALDFRSVNVVLGEVTNLVWGAFKARYGARKPAGGIASQVPIVVNHLHRYISFGSSDPQLCLRCTLTDPAQPDRPALEIHQRFVFSLSWSPEEFREGDASVEKLAEAGELELF